MKQYIIFNSEYDYVTNPTHISLIYPIKYSWLFLHLRTFSRRKCWRYLKVHIVITTKEII